MLRKAAGIEGVRFHDLRHTAASILVSGGASLPLIGALLGHTQVQTTARYAHLFNDPQREAVNRLGAVITGSSKSAEVLPFKKEA
jgi:integrase